MHLQHRMQEPNGQSSAPHLHHVYAAYALKEPITWRKSGGVALCFERVRRIDWSGIDGNPYPLFHLPHWPSEDVLVPVFANLY